MQVAIIIGSSNMRLILAAVAVYILAMYVRAILWRRLLRAPATTTKLFEVTIIGFAVSFLLPLRVGEIARAYLLARWRGIPYGTTLASLAERILDGMAVGLIMVIALLFVPAPSYVLGLAVAVAILFAALTVILIVASWHTGLVIAVGGAATRFLPPLVGVRIQLLLLTFAEGLVALRNLRALPGSLALAVIGWGAQFTAFYLVMLAIPVGGTFPMALLVGGVVNFATLLPSAPGFVGTFDAVLIKLLTDMGSATLDNATAFALIVHAILLVPVVTLASVLLWRSDLSLGHLLGHTVRARRNADAAA